MAPQFSSPRGQVLLVGRTLSGPLAALGEELVTTVLAQRTTSPSSPTGVINSARGAHSMSPVKRKRAVFASSG
jgi:hypothetical protein